MGYRISGLSVRYLLVVLGLLVLLRPAWSQTAEIRVDISDSSGAVMVGVSVMVTDRDTGATHSYVTDSAGLAIAPALPPGSYNVTASFSGFGTEQENTPLTVGQVASIKFVMKPATSTQSVEVHQDAGLEIETTTNDVSGVVAREQLDELPVINRGFVGLAQLLPGGAPSLSGDQRFGIQTTFGGANVRSGYSTLIDGADVDHPIYGLAIVDVDQDAVQEFRVNHNQYDAQYGRAGTAVVDVVTRSGTNTYNGMFTYFGQNQNLNARNFFVNGPQPAYSETITSGIFGGPIIKDKMHFFASDEYLKLNDPYVESLPASNPFASTWNGVFTGLTDEKLVQAKVDYEPNANNNFYLRYLLEDQTITSSYTLYQNYKPILFHDFILTWGHIFSPSAINNSQLEYLDQNTGRYENATGPEIVRPSFTSGNAPNLPQGYPRHRLAFNDTFYLTKGRNSIKAGTRLGFERLYQEGNFYGSGVWTFNTDSPFNAAVQSTYPTQYQVGSGPSTVLYRNIEMSYFLQDDIKLSPRLTLNAGVRYDAETNLRENRFVNEMLQNPVLPGLNTFVTPNRGNGNNLSLLQPRLGLAWDLKGNGKTVIRAGFGGMAARNRPFFDTQMQAQDTAFTIVVTDPTILANYALYTPTYSPTPMQILNGQTIEQYALSKGNRSLYLVGDHLDIPYAYELSLGVEKALFKDTVLTVDGLRQIQTKLQTAHDANLPAKGPLTQGTLVRPLPQFGSVSLFNGTTSGYYTALDVQLKSQFRRAAVNLSYTFAKSISDGLDDNTSAISDPFHEYGNNDRGYDEEDRKSGLSLSPLLKIPWDFQLSSIMSFITGPPWNILYGKDLDKDGVVQDRPAGLRKNVGGRAKASDLAIINAARTSTTSTTLPSGLVIPALNLTPVTMAQVNQADGQMKIDVRLTKGFNFKERYRLEVFMEAYDITNTPSFGPPSGTITSAAFLTRSTAANPRQMQWGTRFIFGTH